MDRLTFRSSDGQAHATRVGFYDFVEKLADYEDLEEQGLLLRLPCKVGTPIYYIGSNINRDTNEWEFFVQEYGFESYMIDELGEKYFLTKAEAEKKLAEMEKHNV